MRPKDLPCICVETKSQAAFTPETWFEWDAKMKFCQMVRFLLMPYFCIFIWSVILVGKNLWKHLENVVSEHFWMVEKNKRFSSLALTAVWFRGIYTIFIHGFSINAVLSVMSSYCGENKSTLLHCPFGVSNTNCLHCIQSVNMIQNFN